MSDSSNEEVVVKHVSKRRKLSSESEDEKQVSVKKRDVKQELKVVEKLQSISAIAEDYGLKVYEKLQSISAIS